MAIAAMKIAEGAGLAALGLGARHFLQGDGMQEIGHWIDLLRMDPHSRYLLWIVEKLAKVDERRLRELSVGTFFYSALFLCEGTGLALGKRWAEYLTITSTASFMPVELYQIWIHPTWAKAGVLVVNAIIVGYLVWELRRSRA